jgi:light-regulated signal transduction histidine kinase (bacteriophytochrome)
MANVVGREIYGPLTSKQKEYLEIIQHSGRYLLSLVNEISELGTLDDSTLKLNLTSVDIEMLCQQVINTLEEVANRRAKISLSVEPGRSRSWILDKDKVRQLLYHLVLVSVIQTANTGSIIRIHVSHKSDGLNLAVGVSHPWLGGFNTSCSPYFYQSPVSVVSDQSDSVSDNTHSQRPESPYYLPQTPSR